jgi:cell shape-determining protein MreC
MKYKHLESEINRYKAELNDLVHRLVKKFSVKKDKKTNNDLQNSTH